MRAVFLNQRDLLIMRGARPAAGLGGLATAALVFAKAAGAQWVWARVRGPRLREYGTDFVVGRCQQAVVPPSLGEVATGTIRWWMLAARKG